MRFGGHETFPIREGWLNKGLRLLVEDPIKMTDEYYADWLGVGRNMGKAIKHWLVATGIAQPLDQKRSREAPLNVLPWGSSFMNAIPIFWKRARGGRCMSILLITLIMHILGAGISIHSL